jgi:MFS family permease
MNDDSLDDLFDIGSLFRSSATLTFIVQILSMIIMVGALAGFYIGDYLPGLNDDLRILLFLVGSVITLIVFLMAFSVFTRFSRRISNIVIGPGIEKVRLDSPRVKGVVYTYGILVSLMGVTGVYIWYLVYKYILDPWIVSHGNSFLLTIFSYALGAFFIALLIQLIVAGVGRSATKVIIEVLDTDDSEFLD